MIRIRLLGPGKLSDFRFSTHAAAEAALLAHAGHPPAERITVREATGAMLASGGLAEYAPAILEVIGTGEFIVVPAPNRLLTTSGRVTLIPWRRARLLGEAAARQREAERFAALPISRALVQNLG
ncbi:MAG: hypothetical protein FJW31_31380 [Acidobacteria bacterium]|nr:hypothetical protein [Acidobacteriota bacterium]